MGNKPSATQADLKIEQYKYALISRLKTVFDEKIQIEQRKLDQQSVVEFPQQLVSLINNPMFKQFADVQFIIASRSINCHKAILEARKQILNILSALHHQVIKNSVRSSSNNDLNNNNDMRTIDFFTITDSGIVYDDFITLLQFIYCGTVDQLSNFMYIVHKLKLQDYIEAWNEIQNSKQYKTVSKKNQILYLRAYTYEAVSKNSIRKDLENMLKSQKFTDVEFVCQDGTIKVHKIILCLRSPYFSAMLTGGMKEASQQTINIPFVNTDLFWSVMILLYGDRVSVQPEIIFDFVQCCKQFNVEYQILRCQETMYQFIDTDNVIDALNICQMYDLHPLYEYCFYFAILQYNTISKQPEFSTLSPQIKLELNEQLQKGLKLEYHTIISNAFENQMDKLFQSLKINKE